MTEKNTTLVDDFTEDDKVENNLNLWNYTEQPEFLGVVLRKEQGMYGEQIVMQDPSNEEVVMPSLSALNTQLKNAREGDKVKIVFKGEEKSQKTGRMYKNFEVFIKSQ